MPSNQSSFSGTKGDSVFLAGRQRGRQPRKRILVTGGAGFIGCHLCERLLAQGHEVLCLDNFSTGCRQNLRGLLGHPRFRLVEHDIIAPIDLEADQIFNLACPASPLHYQTDPVQTTKTSVLGALNVLELARRQRIPVLQASFAGEGYGDAAVHPQREDNSGKVNLIGKRTCYDEGKRCAESLFFDFHRQYGVAVKVCRIFNTYGPRMHPDDGKVISNFMVQALQNQPLTVYGTGSQTRSFCYVSDMVNALIKLMWAPASFTGPVNLGNPSECTILDLVELIRQLTHSSSEIVFRPLPEDDPLERQPDIGMARRVLHWEPKVRLREGLTLTAAYFHEVLRRRQGKALRYSIKETLPAGL